MGDLGFRVRGVAEVRTALHAMDVRVDVATVAALKAMQNAAKRNIKSRMRGKPRWNHRGTGRTGPAITVAGATHSPRSGGPGKLTGHLAAGVGGVRRPKPRGLGVWAGGVGIGGNAQNLYKRQTEAKFPAVKPGVEKAIAEGEPIWAKAWDKAIHL